MLGLGRSSLKRRPSILDLIRQTSGSSFFEQAGAAPADDKLPPATSSRRQPTSSNTNDDDDDKIDEENAVLHLPLTPELQPLPSSTMPSKESKKTPAGVDGEHDGAVFSISGPVIVAENMIGCAMYEMVSRTFTVNYSG